jgi:hypothetical protein
MLVSALVPLMLVAAGTVPAAVQLPDPRIEVWLDSDTGYALGEHGRVLLRTAQDGYVVVLHADPAGRVRVLFPLNPYDDEFVPGGRAVEIRGHGDRDAFQVDEPSGTGLVLAAWSPEPFRFDGFARDGLWDVLSLAPRGVTGDAESDLLEVVHRMSPGRSFHYDAVTYVVGAAPSRPVPARIAADGYGVSAGHAAAWGPRCRSCGPSARRSGLHLSVGIGFGAGWVAGSWLYDPFWHPYWYAAWHPALWYPRVVYRPVFVPVPVHPVSVWDPYRYYDPWYGWRGPRHRWPGPGIYSYLFDPYPYPYGYARPRARLGIASGVLAERFLDPLAPPARARLGPGRTFEPRTAEPRGGIASGSGVRFATGRPGSGPDRPRAGIRLADDGTAPPLRRAQDRSPSGRPLPGTAPTEVGRPQFVPDRAARVLPAVDPAGARPERADGRGVADRVRAEWPAERQERADDRRVADRVRAERPVDRPADRTGGVRAIDRQTRPSTAGPERRAGIAAGPRYERVIAPAGGERRAVQRADAERVRPADRGSPASRPATGPALPRVEPVPRQAVRRPSENGRPVARPGAGSAGGTAPAPSVSDRSGRASAPAARAPARDGRPAAASPGRAAGTGRQPDRRR